MCCRHAATMDSISPASSTSQDTPEVRQKLSFDWYGSRFAETAEQDPLSSTQQQRTQQASATLANKFQAFTMGRSTQSSTSASKAGVGLQSRALPGSLQSMHSMPGSMSDLNSPQLQDSLVNFNAITPRQFEANQSLASDGQDSLSKSRDKAGSREAVLQTGSALERCAFPTLHCCHMLARQQSCTLNYMSLVSDDIKHGICV